MTLAVVHLSGWLALLSLAASLALSLAARWRVRRARLLALRRVLGLAGLALAALHAIVTMGGLLAPGSGTEAAALFEGLPYLRHGALALALLLPLAATSFPRLNARLGLRAWSALHRLVYAALALAALHVLAGPSADPRLAVAVAGLIAALLLARLVPSSRSTRESATAPITDASAATGTEHGGPPGPD